MDWRNSPSGEFLRRCRDLAGDEIIDDIIRRYRGIWLDVGRRSRDAAIDGIRYRYEEATIPDRGTRRGWPKVPWKNEAERRRWCAGPQPETARREEGIALTKILPLEKREEREWSRPSKCYICDHETYHYVDTESQIPMKSHRQVLWRTAELWK